MTDQPKDADEDEEEDEEYLPPWTIDEEPVSHNHF